MDCEIGDIVKIVWQDVGANHEYHPIINIKELLKELRKDFTIITYGEVIYLDENEIHLTYSKTEDEARVIYLRNELIRNIKVLK